jgi:hypothetical protein
MFRPFRRFLIQKIQIYLDKNRQSAFAPRPGGADFSPFRRMTRRLCALVVLKVRERNKADQRHIDHKISELREAFHKAE